MHLIAQQTNQIEKKTMHILMGMLTHQSIELLEV